MITKIRNNINLWQFFERVLVGSCNLLDANLDALFFLYMQEFVHQNLQELEAFFLLSTPTYVLELLWHILLHIHHAQNLTKNVLIDF